MWTQKGIAQTLELVPSVNFGYCSNGIKTNPGESSFNSPIQPFLANIGWGIAIEYKRKDNFSATFGLMSTGVNYTYSFDTKSKGGNMLIRAGEEYTITEFYSLVNRISNRPWHLGHHGLFDHFYLKHELSIGAGISIHTLDKYYDPPQYIVYSTSSNGIKAIYGNKYEKVNSAGFHVIAKAGIQFFNAHKNKELFELALYYNRGLIPLSYIQGFYIIGTERHDYTLVSRGTNLFLSLNIPIKLYSFKNKQHSK